MPPIIPRLILQAPSTQFQTYTLSDIISLHNWPCNRTRPSITIQLIPLGASFKIHYRPTHNTGRRTIAPCTMENSKLRPPTIPRVILQAPSSHSSYTVSASPLRTTAMPQDPSIYHHLAHTPRRVLQKLRYRPTHPPPSARRSSSVIFLFLH